MTQAAVVISSMVNELNDDIKSRLLNFPGQKVRPGIHARAIASVQSASAAPAVTSGGICARGGVWARLRLQLPRDSASHSPDRIRIQHPGARPLQVAIFNSQAQDALDIPEHSWLRQSAPALAGVDGLGGARGRGGGAAREPGGQPAAPNSLGSPGTAGSAQARRRRQPRPGALPRASELCSQTPHLTGGTKAVPVTSIAMSNVLETSDDKWNSESVLVHEFSHAIHNLGLNDCEAAAVKAAYDSARGSGAYSPNSYSMTNEFEYVAEGSQVGGVGACACVSVVAFGVRVLRVLVATAQRSVPCARWHT